jgi:hypothetical protein
MFNKDGSTEFIRPVYPPSIIIFLPFSLIITSFFFLSAFNILPSIPEIPTALIPARKSIPTIALFIFPDITIV